MYLTPVKGGEQIAWLKQSGREDASEQTGDEYEDFMKRLEMSDCSITSDESKRSKTENRPPLSSVGQKQTLKGTVQLKFTSQSPIKKRFEQKQPNLQEKEDTLEENVNEEIVGDRRMISEDTTEGNVELEFTPQSSIKNRSVQKRRKLEQNRETLENNNEESVSDGRVISENITEGNAELEFTSQSPIKNISVQKQRETLENNNEESVIDGRVICEDTTEGNAELELISQSPIKKRSEQKQRELLESEDTPEDNVNEESVDERRIMSEKTLEGNGRFEFTSPSPNKKRTEQTQRKLQESEDTLEKNVNEESVDERRIITEKILEGNGRFESTSRSPNKKKRSDRRRGIVEDEVTLEENVHEESVDGRRMITEKTTEGNVELKFTPQSPTKNRSVQKQRETLENNNEESVSDGRVISENTTEGNVELEFSSQSPIKKRSEAKQRNLQENEDTLEKNVNEERVDERRIILEKSLEGNGRFEFTSPSPIKKRSDQKQRKLQESEDTLEKNVNVESVDEKRMTSEKILEGNRRFESTSQSPTKKKRPDRQRRIVEDLDTLEENVHEGSVGGRKMISEKTTEGNVKLKFTPQSPNKDRSVQKQRETLENNNEKSVSDGRVISDDTTEGNAELEFISQSPSKNRSVQKQRETLENNNAKSVSDGRVISEDTTEGNAELELISQSPIKNRSEQKQRNLQENEDTLEKNLNEERVDERGIFSGKSLKENGRFEFTSPSPNKRRRSEQEQRNLQESEDTLGENVNEESVDERRIMSEKTVEENGRFEFTSPRPNKRRSEQKQRNLQGSEDTLGKNVNEESVDERRIVSEKTVEENGRFEFTSPSSFKKRSEQKQQNLQENGGTLEENVNEESVDEKRIISEKTLEENGRFNKSTSRLTRKKRSDRKRRIVEDEVTLEENVHEESVNNRGMISKKTTEGNVELKFTSQSPIENRSVKKQRETLENNNEESVSDGRVISENTTEGNAELELISQSPIKKRSEPKQRNLQESEDTLEKNLNEERVDERGIFSEKSLKENGRFEFTSPSPNKRRRSEQKQRNLQESEDTLGENVNEESVDERRIMSEKTVEENGRFEFTSPRPNKRRSEQKQRNLQGSEDTLGKNVNEESVDERRIVSEKTVEENGRFEFTSPSSFKKRSEQKQQNLQENGDTLEENVNEESVDEKRIISEKTVEENGRFEFTSPRPNKRRSEQKQRNLQGSEDTLGKNVNEESVDERRIVSEKTVEENGRFEFTSPSSFKKRSEQKQQNLQENGDTLGENVNEESVDERRIMSEKTVEENGRFEFTSPRPNKRRSEQKQRNLQGSEDTLEKNVNEERVDERIMSEKTLKRDERFEFTSSPVKKRSEQTQRKLQESEGTREGNLNQESVDERGIMSEKTLEENGRFEFTSPSPIKKRSEQKQRKLQESEDTLEENVNEESVDERRIISEKILEGNRRFKFTSPSPNKKRSKQKQRKLQESEDTQEENLNEESLSETTITSKKRLQNNVELECAAKEHVNNNNNIKIGVKRKAAKRRWGVLRKSDSQASVGMETPTKLGREDSYCKDKSNDEYNDRKTQEGANNISDGRQEGNHIEMLKKNKKKKRGKRKGKSELCGTESTPESTPTSSFLEEGESSQSKDQQDGRVEREFASNVKNKHQISNAKAKKGSDCDLVQKQESLVFNAFGEMNFKKKDRYWEEKRGEDNEKSNDRKTSNQGKKVNSRDDQLQKEVNAQHSKKKKKKKEKKRKHVLNSMESAIELPSSLNLETVTSDSLDDSGYGENGHNKSKQHEQCEPERVESVHQPLFSKKRKAAANHQETPSGQGLLV